MHISEGITLAHIWKPIPALPQSLNPLSPNTHAHMHPPPWLPCLQVDSGEHDASDYASIVALYGGDATAGGRLGRQRQAERGFTGTALAGLHTAFEEDGGDGEEAGAGAQEQGQGEEDEGQGAAAEPMAQD